MVVYAAEIGYEYSGDEYWPVFEARTPWWEMGDRDLLRVLFVRFKESFGGAEPTGRWARQFVNICWPITHAVLPADLQRQLAELLFDFRAVLSSDLLADSKELGARLALYAGRYSKRFQIFAENSDLLGQVASALLLGEQGDSPFLLNSTLSRIVKSISQVREARHWLDAAKLRADGVRMKGFAPLTAGPEPRQSSNIESALIAPRKERIGTLTDPSVVLAKDEAGWTAYLEFPDLTLLGERLSGIGEDLRTKRAIVAGSAGPPLARGRLLYEGQRIRLSEWPHNVPILKLENASPGVNGLLSDQCVLTPGPHWLFRVKEGSLALEVKGKAIRPSGHYLLLSEDLLDEYDLPSWFSSVECPMDGVVAHRIDTPETLTPSHAELIRNLGLSVITDVAVRPVGVVAARWDGEGSVQWLVDDSPLIAIRTNGDVLKCVVTVDGQRTQFDWPDATSEIFVSLGYLDVGLHDVRVSLMPRNGSEQPREGRLAVGIRPQQVGGSENTFRQALQLFASPVKPTLGELWDGRATIEVFGPSDTSIWLEVFLWGRKNSMLASRRFELSLPIDHAKWALHWARRIRSDPTLQNVYAQAERCTISAIHSALGSIAIECEREFAPLRWANKHKGNTPYVQLVNSTAKVPLVQFSTFTAPDQPVSLDPGQDTVFAEAGGLVSASIDDLRASVLLPPVVNDWEALKGLKIAPRIANVPKTVDGIVGLISLSNDWATASLPANVFALRQRRSVLRAFTRKIVGLISGRKWADLELKGSRTGDFWTISDLRIGMGTESFEPDLARELRNLSYQVSGLPAEKIVAPFANVLNSNIGLSWSQVDQRYGEFLLRLASDPWSLWAWSDSFRRKCLARTLSLPVRLRAARFMVLAIHSSEETDSPEEFGDTSTFGGWTWT